MAKYVTGEGLSRFLSNMKTWTNAQIAVETNRAKGVEAGLQGAIDTLNGLVTEDGSVLKMIKDNAGSATYGDTTIAAAIKANSDAIAAQGKGMFKIVEKESDIPVSAAGLGYIYLVPKSATKEGAKGYLEFVVINTGTEDVPVYAKEGIGDTDISFDGLATEAWVNANAKDAVYSVSGETKVTIAEAIAAEVSRATNAEGELANTIGDWSPATPERETTVKKAIEDLEAKVTGTTVKSVNGHAANESNKGDVVITAADIDWVEAGEGVEAVTVKDELDSLSTAVGASTDTTSSTGSIYARIAQNAADIAQLDSDLSDEATARSEADVAINNKIGTWKTAAGNTDRTDTITSAITALEAATVNVMSDSDVDALFAETPEVTE